MLHPDKLVSSYGRSQQQQMQQQISLEEKKQATRRFVDLQQAWELYEKTPTNVRKRMALMHHHLQHLVLLHLLPPYLDQALFGTAKKNGPSEK